jgi:hypothetical protein
MQRFADVCNILQYALSVVLQAHVLRRISSSSGFVALNTWRVTTKTRVAETIRCGRENVAATAERTRLAARQLADGTKSQAMALRKAEWSKTNKTARKTQKKEAQDDPWTSFWKADRTRD